MALVFIPAAMQQLHPHIHPTQNHSRLRQAQPRAMAPLDIPIPMGTRSQAAKGLALRLLLGLRIPPKTTRSNTTAKATMTQASARAAASTSSPLLFQFAQNSPPSHVPKISLSRSHVSLSLSFLVSEASDPHQDHCHPSLNTTIPGRSTPALDTRLLYQTATEIDLRVNIPRTRLPTTTLLPPMATTIPSMRTPTP